MHAGLILNYFPECTAPSIQVKSITFRLDKKAARFRETGCARLTRLISQLAQSQRLYEECQDLQLNSIKIFNSRYLDIIVANTMYSQTFDNREPITHMAAIKLHMVLG